MNLFDLQARPSRLQKLTLAAIPLVLILLAYSYFSDQRISANPQDKLMPSASKMLETMQRITLKKNRRTGEYQLLNDTYASLKRIGLGMLLSSISGLLIGLIMGVYPRIQALLLPAVTFLSNVPPLALLPIFLIVFDTGELSKVALIFTGTVFIISRDIFLTVNSIPTEQIIKSMTLGASSFGVAFRIVLPQIIPRLLDTVRLSLGSAWLFLIAAEAVAAESGLGYRIFLVRRFLSMDVIIPYVIWITILAFLVDRLLKKIVDWKYHWYVESRS